LISAAVSAAICDVFKASACVDVKLVIDVRRQPRNLRRRQARYIQRVEQSSTRRSAASSSAHAPASSTARSLRRAQIVERRGRQTADCVAVTAPSCVVLKP